MEKNQKNMKISKALLGLCAGLALAIPASVTPSLAAPDIPIMNQIQMESGANYKHNTDSLEFKRDQQYINEDYNRYERRKNAVKNPSKEN